MIVDEAEVDFDVWRKMSKPEVAIRRPRSECRPLWRTSRDKTSCTGPGNIARTPHACSPACRPGDNQAIRKCRNHNARQKCVIQILIK